MFNVIRTAMRDAKETGASAVEYALMVAAIAAVIVGIVFGLGTLIGNTFNDTCASVKGKTATTATGGATDCAGTTAR